MKLTRTKSDACASQSIELSTYHQLALDCINLAEGARDQATQNTLIRLAKHWARLADRAELQSGNAKPAEEEHWRSAA